MKYSAIQMEYKKLQVAEPSQVNLKHMLDQETFFIIGQSIAQSNRYADESMAIAAYSSKFKRYERVDTMFFKGTGTHYGLNLPAGSYTLLIYADLNKDNTFQPSEIVGQRELVLNTSSFSEKVVRGVDIKITEIAKLAWADTIMAPRHIVTKHSLYYPTGSIRSLDDPIFNANISTIGMYDPASFLESAPTMFYALEESVAHKIPVIFVHGIGGSSRNFKKIIESMDQNRYQTWLFYYPSGGDLDQLADFFYNIFLSGAVINKKDMPMIVVAHSMGGIIVREAFNKYQGKSIENKVNMFFSIASPFGGHPAAALSEKHGLMVLPSWKDLNPTSPFIQNLFRKPLPEFINHQLYYAYNDSRVLKLGENSDGVVPLLSQLNPQAQQQSDKQFGFNSSHVDILENKHMIKQMLEQMAKVKNIFPESHMKLLVDGGFNVKLSDDYSPASQHLINYAGKYIIMLVKDIIKPINLQQASYIRAIQGKTSATKTIEKDFIKFMKAYPHLVKSVLAEQPPQ